MRDSVGRVRPEEICGLLAERDRLAAYAAVVLGAQEAAFKEAVREYAVSGGQKAPEGDLDRTGRTGGPAEV